MNGNSICLRTNVRGCVECEDERREEGSEMKTEEEIRDLLFQARKDLAAEEVKRGYGISVVVALYQARAVVATLLKVLGE